MSKYYGKQAPKPAPKGKLSLAWFAVVAAFALIITGTIVLARPSQNAGAASAGGGPKAAVDRDKLDFGKVKMNTPVTATFKLKNEGSAALQILGEPQVRVVEGC
jgi:hypothetical protein